MKLGLLGGADRPPRPVAAKSDFRAVYTRLRELRNRYRYDPSTTDITREFKAVIDRVSRTTEREFGRFGGNAPELGRHPSGITRAEQAYLALQETARQAARDGDPIRAGAIRVALDAIDKMAVEGLQALTTKHGLAEAPSTQAVQQRPAAAEPTVPVAAIPPPARTPVQFDWVTVFRPLRDLGRRYATIGQDFDHADFRSADNRITKRVMRRFRRFGGDSQHLPSRSSCANSTEQAYRAIQEMFRRAEASDNTARALRDPSGPGGNQPIHSPGAGQADHEVRCARCPVRAGYPDHPGHVRHAGHAGHADHAGHAGRAGHAATAADRWLVGDRRVDDGGGRRPVGYPRPGAPHRAGGQSRVPTTGRRTRACDGCPRSAPGVQSPRAFPLRSHRRRRRRPLARVDRPARHRLRYHGHATGCHRGHRHALARRDVLVLAATGRPGAGAGLRSLRLRPAPRRRDRATPSRHHHRARRRSRSLSRRPVPHPFEGGRRLRRRARPPRRPAPPGVRCVAAHRPGRRVQAIRARGGTRRGPAPDTDHRPIDGWVSGDRRGGPQRAAHRASPLPEGEHRACSARSVSGASRPGVARPGAGAGAAAPAR